MLSSSKNLMLLSSHAQMPWSSKAHKIQSSHAPNFSSSKALKLLSSKHIKNKTCIDLGIVAHAPSLTSFLLLLLLPIAAKAIVLTEDVQCWRDNKHGTETRVHCTFWGRGCCGNYFANVRKWNILWAKRPSINDDTNFLRFFFTPPSCHFIK